MSTLLASNYGFGKSPAERSKPELTCAFGSFQDSSGYHCSRLQSELMESYDGPKDGDKSKIRAGVRSVQLLTACSCKGPKGKILTWPRKRSAANVLAFAAQYKWSIELTERGGKTACASQIGQLGIFRSRLQSESTELTFLFDASCCNSLWIL